MPELAAQDPGQLAADEANVLLPEERAAKRMKMDVSGDSGEAHVAEDAASGHGVEDPAGKADETVTVNGRDSRQSGLAPIKKE